MTTTPNTHQQNYLLINLIEECAEVIQAATKCLRFGIAHYEPGYGHNGHEVANEIGQAFAAYDTLCIYGHPHFPVGPQGVGYKKKQDHLHAWLSADGK